MITTAQKLEIIEDTRAFYSGHPERFGWDDETNSCVYLSSTGNKCAIGRHLPEDSPICSVMCSFALLSSFSRHTSALRAIPLFSDDRDDMFWIELQRTHDDTASAWNMTKDTEEARAMIFEKFDKRIERIMKSVEKGEL